MTFSQTQSIQCNGDGVGDEEENDENDDDEPIMT